MKISDKVRGSLNPDDLKDIPEGVYAECFAEEPFDWKGQKIPSLQFCTEVKGVLYEVSIFASKIVCPKGKSLDVGPGGKYLLKRKSDKLFLIDEAN